MQLPDDGEKSTNKKKWKIVCEIIWNQNIL